MVWAWHAWLPAPSNRVDGCQGPFQADWHYLRWLPVQTSLAEGRWAGRTDTQQCHLSFGSVTAVRVCVCVFVFMCPVCFYTNMYARLTFLNVLHHEFEISQFHCYHAIANQVFLLRWFMTLHCHNCIIMVTFNFYHPQDFSYAWESLWYCLWAIIQSQSGFWCCVVDAIRFRVSRQDPGGGRNSQVGKGAGVGRHRSGGDFLSRMLIQTP